MKEKCNTCGGCFMVPSDDPNGDVMNTPCPDCNKPPAVRPTPEDIARVKWNRTADDYNQWDTLDIEEKRELIAMETTPPAESTTPITDAAFPLSTNWYFPDTPEYLKQRETCADLERQLVEAREMSNLQSEQLRRFSDNIGNLERQLAEVSEQRDALAALVGIIRQHLPVPLRNVSDISPEEHIQEIGGAIESIIEQRDALLTALRTWQRIANAGANHEGIAKARQQTNAALAAVERSNDESR